jgi:peptidoglycan/LPS O-acetylase OafA/YrhL
VKPTGSARFFSAGREAGKILNSSILQFIGAISYGIYGLHSFVLMYVGARCSQNYWDWQ